MMRVGIVAEGKSEWFVLESFMRALHADIDFERLRPDLTLASKSPFGWKGVRAWCREFGGKLETFMRGVKGRELDLLVIHADCSMAHNEGAARPCPPAEATASALRTVVIEQWLGLRAQPPYVLVTNPSLSTDAWVVASLEPPYARLAGLECDGAAENELVKRNLLRKKDGEVKKSEARYLPLAEEAARHLERVCQHCTQAARFREDFEAAASQVRLGLWN